MQGKSMHSHKNPSHPHPKSRDAFRDQRLPNAIIKSLSVVIVATIATIYNSCRYNRLLQAKRPATTIKRWKYYYNFIIICTTIIIASLLLLLLSSIKLVQEATRDHTRDETPMKTTRKWKADGCTKVHPQQILININFITSTNIIIMTDSAKTISIAAASHHHQHTTQWLNFRRLHHYHHHHHEYHRNHDHHRPYHHHDHD